MTPVQSALKPATAKPMAPKLADEADIAIIEPLCAVFRRALREQGLKYTAERARVLDAIVRFEEAFDGEELLASLRGTGARATNGTVRVARPALRVSKATAYRTLKLLQDIGALRRVLVKGEAKYELSQVVSGGAGATTLAMEGEGQERMVPAPELERAVREMCERMGAELVRWEARVVMRTKE
jgi:Fur family transcriptional regulator, ferric uptake regulator